MVFLLVPKSCSKFQLCLASAALILGGCGSPLAKKEPNSETASYADGASTKLRLQPPELAESVPSLKKLPANIFASDIELKDLSADAFTQDYASAVQKATGMTNVAIEAPLIVRIKVHPGDSKSSKIDLHKIWQKCKDKPGDRAKVMEPGISALFDMVNFVTKPLEGEEQGDKVVPLLRNRHFLENLIAQRGGAKKSLANHFQPGDDVYYEAIFGGLFIIYSVHDPSGIRLLDSNYYTHHLALGAEALKARSVQNLERLTASTMSLEADGPILRVTTDDNYEPSLILSDRAIAILQKRVAGRLVVAIPDNNVLLICGDETPGALLKLKEATDQAYNHGKYKISDRLFVRDQGAWQTFTAFSSK
jgi:hypothetical protein